MSSHLTAHRGGVIRYCDAEALQLTPEEIAHLEQLPDAAFGVLLELECALGNVHAGAHVALGRSQDHTSDDRTHWWLRWTDEGGRKWTHAAICSAESGEEMCLLPAGHEAGHHWT